MVNVSASADWVGSVRKPVGWYVAYLDGQVWEFHENVDFKTGDAKKFRNRFISYVFNYNKDAGYRAYQIRTSIRAAEDGHMIVYIQSYD